ncbi:MAG: imidazole glycerol phosphate synthase subunit HisH [Halobacteriales archaeon]|nr:imidazole glycerol phosphate synthase subunit HisH [Halobacteriales archaeon]
MRGLLVDYGVGNIHSVRRGVEKAGARLDVQARPSAAQLKDADFLVLPGVGSFSAGARGLTGVRRSLLAQLEHGKPALGICLGMQLLFERSEEGPGEGLGFLPGEVRRLRGPKFPQVGWNGVAVKRDPLFEGLGSGFDAYFVNSFAPVPATASDAIAHATYGTRFVAGVRRLNTWGVQFHPEKSSAAGLRILRNFTGLCEELA